MYLSIFTASNEARWKRAETFLEQFNSQHRSSYTMDQLLNAYVLAHPRTDMLAIGAITVEQVRRTVAAIGMSKMLTPADLEFLHSGVESKRKPGCLVAIFTGGKLGAYLQR